MDDVQLDTTHRACHVTGCDAVQLNRIHMGFRMRVSGVAADIFAVFQGTSIAVNASRI